MTCNPDIAIAPEIADALATGGPVVALESTIITHGLPHPRNLEVARALEAAIRQEGAVPATIAVIDGAIRVGLDDAALQDLAARDDVLKLSRADLGVALVKGATGSTTVAATMILARLVRICVFATGGIGGVHRGAAETFDVSADLQELAQTPVTVVAAGAKAILDVPKTLEMLETLGVPVIGYRTAEFPAFWSRQSGLDLTLRLETPEEIAAAHLMRARLGIPGGQLVANPIPETHEIPAAEITGHIETALADLAGAEVQGKAVTPYLLDRVLALTEGRSLDSNTALVLNNARLAAQIARAMGDQR